MHRIYTKKTIKPRCPHCRGTGYDAEFSSDGSWISQPCEFCGGTGSMSGVTLLVASFGDISTARPA